MVGESGLMIRESVVGVYIYNRGDLFKGLLVGPTKAKQSFGGMIFLLIMTYIISLRTPTPRGDGYIDGLQLFGCKMYNYFAQKMGERYR